ncbi:MAG: DEAD/DEAH box helicase [Nitrososphaerota archaeon]
MISDEELDVLQRMCDQINQDNDVPDFRNLFLRSLLNRIEPSFRLRVPLSEQLSSLVPLEVARILRALRQRFSPQEEGTPLVSRIRMEVRERMAPPLSLQNSDIDRQLEPIARIGGHSRYSEFQVAAWREVRQALSRARAGEPVGLVLTAPTGGGKTEAFLLPLIEAIASSMARSHEEVPRFMVLYPRKALIQDQIRRVFRYVRMAERQFPVLNRRIIVGLQFAGIRSRLSDTLRSGELFDDQGAFALLDQCPWCGGEARLRYEQDPFGRSLLRCPLCEGHICVSLSKEEHGQRHPHLMLTTAEALDRLTFSMSSAWRIPSM